MAYQFNQDEKEVREFAETMPFGVNHVTLLLAEAAATDQGKEYIELNVANSDGIEDKARVWFVGNAINISFNTLRQILVHNASTEEEKATIRDAADKVKDSAELADLLNSTCVNGELWLTKYYDDKGNTWTAPDGKVLKSINKNVYGYEPKLKPELMPRKADAQGNPVDNVKSVMGGGEEVDAGSTVPADGAWAS